MERGNVVIVSAKGDYGKTRPAIVVQDTRMERVVESVTVCLMTTDLIEEGSTLRVDIAPMQMRAVDIGLLVHLGLAAQLGVPAPQLTR